VSANASVISVTLPCVAAGFPILEAGASWLDRCFTLLERIAR
jgi:hypothetical protein